MNEKILKVLKQYTGAILKKDYAKLYELLYKEDIKEYRLALDRFANLLEYFNGINLFLKLMNLKSREELQEMNDIQFIQKMFSIIEEKIDFPQKDKLVSSIKIESLDHIEYLTNVTYSFLNDFSDPENPKRTKKELNMILVQGNWVILFKPALKNFFNKYEQGKKDFEERKKRDNTKDNIKEEDLEVFSLFGYKTKDGEKIIEPRFLDAKPFSEGLAAVQTFKKFGYINLKGEMVIRPQFLEAYEFQNGLAKVKIPNDKKEFRYGFIDRTGAFYIKPEYREASQFCEGLCAVKKDYDWGYIKPDGTMAIDCQFLEASDFKGGKSLVVFKAESGEKIKFHINYKGEMLDI